MSGLSSMNEGVPESPGRVRGLVGRYEALAKAMDLSPISPQPRSNRIKSERLTSSSPLAQGDLGQPMLPFLAERAAAKVAQEQASQIEGDGQAGQAAVGEEQQVDAAPSQQAGVALQIQSWYGGSAARRQCATSDAKAQDDSWVECSSEPAPRGEMKAALRDLQREAARAVKTAKLEATQEAARQRKKLASRRPLNVLSRQELAIIAVAEGLKVQKAKARVRSLSRSNSASSLCQKQ
jgi:hypothetical protein